MKDAFNEYVELFKTLPLAVKKEETIKEMKTLIALLSKLKLDLKIEDNLLLNREVLDIQKSDATEDDFVEAVFVYINTIKESLADYLEVTTDILYEEE